MGGCVIVINNEKPTPDEQALINIQSEGIDQVNNITEKIGKGGYSMEQIQIYLNEGQKIINDNLQKIEQLKLPERARALAEKTKAYLEKARETYTTLMQMSGQANQKVQEIFESMKKMSEPLINMTKQMDEVRVKLLNELQKAAAAQ